MKVGLFIGDVKQTEGGAYTFAKSLLTALNRNASSHAHEFTVIHQGQQGAASLAGSLQQVNLALEKTRVLTTRERVFMRLPNIAGRIWNRLFPAPTLLEWPARVYRELGLQFVLPLNQWTPTSFDVPFGTIVWDLQHRNNPWFPEVSELGQWESREQNMRNQCQRASLILTGTEQGADEIEFYYRVPRSRIKVLPFCTPEFALEAATRPARPELLRDLNLPPKYLLYPAQFWPHKNHAAILRACSRLKDLGLGIVFVGADKGNLGHVQDQANQLGIASTAIFLGFVSQETLVEMYKGALAMVFATYCGPDNLPPLEAFALGCPVIASSVPGAQEQLGDSALFFPPSDDATLSQHVRALHDDAALRQRMIGSGRARASSRTWDGYVATLASHLDEFANVRQAWGE